MYDSGTLFEYCCIVPLGVDSGFVTRKHSGPSVLEAEANGAAACNANLHTRHFWAHQLDCNTEKLFIDSEANLSYMLSRTAVRHATGEVCSTNRFVNKTISYGAPRSKNFLDSFP